ncbi:DUF4397 domain-containing protein, partial [candidate division GN15 bacterium]|nr:DUF4397 domain-containing protein [candidate division GN15 bacterium]
AEASGYDEVLKGIRNLKVQSVAGGAPVIDQNLDLAFNTDYTIFAVDDVAMIDAIYDADARTPNPTAVKIRFVHASPDAGVVDIKTDSGTGTTVFDAMSFKDITSYQEVSSGNYRFVVTADGATEELFVFNPLSLVNNTVYTIMAFGTVDPSDDFPFRVRVFRDNGNGTQFTDATIANAQFRVIHAGLDIYPIDTRVDDSLKHTDVQYGRAGAYAEVAPGDGNVQITQAGFPNVIAVDTTQTFDFRRDYTMVLIDSLNNADALIVQDDRTQNPALVKARVIHASLDAPAVDIRVNSPSGADVFTNVNYRDITSYAEVSGGAYVFSLVEAGTTNEIARYEPVTLSNGSVYSIVAIGTVNPGDDRPFQVLVFTDNGLGINFSTLQPKTGNLRLVHAAYGGPNVDVLVDGGVAQADIAYGATAGYFDVSPGNRNVDVTETGTTTPLLIDTSLAVEPDTSYSLFAVNTGAEVAPILVTDRRTAPASGQVKVRFVNGVSDSGALWLKREVFGFPVPVNSNVAFQAASAYATASTGEYVFQVMPDGVTTTPLIQFQPVTLTSQGVYTVVIDGTVDGGDAFDLNARLILDTGDGTTITPLVPAK